MYAGKSYCYCTISFADVTCQKFWYVIEICYLRTHKVQYHKTSPRFSSVNATYVLKQLLIHRLHIYLFIIYIHVHPFLPIYAHMCDASDLKAKIAARVYKTYLICLGFCSPQFCILDNQLLLDNCLHDPTCALLWK